MEKCYKTNNINPHNYLTKLHSFGPLTWFLFTSLLCHARFYIFCKIPLMATFAFGKKLSIHNFKNLNTKIWTFGLEMSKFNIKFQYVANNI
jgi:hypothetical protein